MEKEETVVLTLTLNEANGILGVLGKQPYDTVVQVINKIQQQYNEQQLSKFDDSKQEAAPTK